MRDKTMYKSFHIKNFRCFRELKMENLERVNLIAGENNVGKTVLLEALLIHCGAYHPELIFKINEFRGIKNIQSLNSWESMTRDSIFLNFNNKTTIELGGDNQSSYFHQMKISVIPRSDIFSLSNDSDVSNIRELENYKPVLLSSKSDYILVFKCEWPDKIDTYFFSIPTENDIQTIPIPYPPPIPFNMLSTKKNVPFKEFAELYGKFQLERQGVMLLNVLREIEPRLTRLEMIVDSGEPILHGDIGTGRILPLSYMGDGLINLSSIFLKISGTANGVLLIDEIENGFHHSTLVKVWKAVGEAARRFNTQIFATTHSWECITAAHQAFSESETYDFRLHRLDRDEDEISVKTYEQEILDTAIEYGMEVR